MKITSPAEKSLGAVRAVQSEAVVDGNSSVLPSSSQTLDVEVVVLDVLGVDAHLGEGVATRVAPRVEQLRMVVATGVGGVIVRYRGVAHENALRLRLRRGRPEEHQAHDEDGGGAAWTVVPTGPVSIPRRGGSGGKVRRRG